MVRCLVDQGADKEKAANNGQTPLVMAALDGRSAVVRYLLEQGADKNITDGEGRTALTWAMQAGHMDVARCLRQH